MSVIEARVAPGAAGCPKHMEYGPCGGVDFDGTCEVAPYQCVFLDLPTVRWAGIDHSDKSDAVAQRVPSAAPSTGSERMRALLATRPIVVADFAARALSAASIVDNAAVLAGHVDAVLAGDSGHGRVQFSPSFRAHLIQQAGLAVWTGLNARDRNRVAIEAEIAGLVEVGVAGVHCITGDHTLMGGRPDAAPVFDLDSTEIASLARAAGLLVSVGESPTTPPVERRPARLVEKLKAGGEVCFINHCGGVRSVAEFIESARELGAVANFVPCVPAVIDRESAGLLRSFTTLVLPEGYLDRIINSDDPRREGIESAVRLSLQLLEIDGVSGVNLSGGSGYGKEVDFSEALAEISDRIGVTL
jgi:5,10-methylenetetrahydrofolate reductase